MTGNITLPSAGLPTGCEWLSAICSPGHTGRRDVFVGPWWSNGRPVLVSSTSLVITRTSVKNRMLGRHSPGKTADASQRETARNPAVIAKPCLRRPRRAGMGLVPPQLSSSVAMKTKRPHRIDEGDWRQNRMIACDFRGRDATLSLKEESANE